MPRDHGRASKRKNAFARLYGGFGASGTCKLAFVQLDTSKTAHLPLDFSGLEFLWRQWRIAAIALLQLIANLTLESRLVAGPFHSRVPELMAMDEANWRVVHIPEFHTGACFDHHDHLDARNTVGMVSWAIR
jgi:hypothetical protein